MIVKNNTSALLLAFGWYKHGGPGEEIIIAPGESKVVIGPYLGKMAGGSCYASVPGEIVCQESPDGDSGYQITEDMPLHLENKGNPNIGITIQFYLEEVIG
jgi:hypothetical protein